jgi:hypothetical protein
MPRVAPTSLSNQNLKNSNPKSRMSVPGRFFILLLYFLLYVYENQSNEMLKG